jgi:hypothetical protein
MAVAGYLDSEAILPTVGQRPTGLWITNQIGVGRE